ncbi:MAG: hypothetical protein IPK64_22050 [bacterium]|nr:hypothetical protein [bacterium]
MRAPPRSRLAAALALALLAAPAAPARAQSGIGATAIEYTALGEASAKELAAHWGLKPEEVEKYRAYMRLEGRYFYAHLDPVMVLGIIEPDPGQRARYAELYLSGERKRIAEQTGFAKLVAAVQLKRYGLEAPVDFSAMPQAASSPGYRQARQDRAAAAAPAAAGPPVPPPAAEPAVPRAGDTVDLLVVADCPACYARLTSVLSVPGVRVHLYGRGFKDPAALVAWLERWPAEGLAPAARAEAAARIEPRRYDPVVFDGHDLQPPPVALLRRGGAVVGRL